jgi:ferritin
LSQFFEVSVEWCVITIDDYPIFTEEFLEKYWVYAHEQKVTGMINALVDLAIREKDHATFEMLQWFVKEQVEEEKNSSEILEQIKIVGDVIGHLFYLDHHLGKRE